jgi:hypothetical protein
MKSMKFKNQCRFVKQVMYEFRKAQGRSLIPIAIGVIGKK